MERDHFEQIKPYDLLCSFLKYIVWLQNTWNATQLVCHFIRFYDQFLQ